MQDLLDDPVVVIQLYDCSENLCGWQVGSWDIFLSAILLANAR